jgi:hypothetical protein
MGLTKTEAWLDKTVLSLLNNGGVWTLDTLRELVPWGDCPVATYRTTDAGGVFPTVRAVDEDVDFYVRSSLGRLSKRGAAVTLHGEYPEKWTASEPPGRFAQKKGIPVPPMGTVLDWQAMAPFGGCLIGWRTYVGDGPLTAIPVEWVVSEPTMAVPKYARVFVTPFVVRDNGSVFAQDDLEAMSFAVHGDRWAIKADGVVCVEVWNNYGDDGHVEYRHDGWAFVSAVRFDAAVRASSERRRGRTPYLSAVRDLIEGP